MVHKETKLFYNCDRIFHHEDLPSIVLHPLQMRRLDWGFVIWRLHKNRGPKEALTKDILKDE